MSDDSRASTGARLLADVLAQTRARISERMGEREATTQARELVAAVLDRSPSSLVDSGLAGHPVSADNVERISRAIDRLQRGAPFAYAVGNAAFRHLTLQVDERVLIPRPETELLIDHVLRLTGGTSGGLAVDIGTGSGAIALALAQEARFDRIIGTDLSTDALALARANAAHLAPMLRSPVEFRAGSDLEPIAGESVTMLVSNPPYIAYTEAHALPALVRNWEPPTALFAPDDGMARYRALLHGAPAVLAAGAWVVLECDSRRADATADIAREVGAYADIQVYDDLSGRPRVLVARFP